MSSQLGARVSSPPTCKHWSSNSAYFVNSLSSNRSSILRPYPFQQPSLCSAKDANRPSHNLTRSHRSQKTCPRCRSRIQRFGSLSALALQYSVRIHLCCSLLALFTLTVPPLGVFALSYWSKDLVVSVVLTILG